MKFLFLKIPLLGDNRERYESFFVLGCFFFDGTPLAVSIIGFVQHNVINSIDMKVGVTCGENGKKAAT